MDTQEGIDIYQIISSVKEGVREYGMLSTAEVESYQHFVEHLPTSMQELFAHIPASLSDAGAIINLFYAITMHLRSGEPVFSLSNNLITLLNITDLPKFDISILKLPFPAIVLDIERNPLLFNNLEILKIYIIATEDRLRIVAAARDTTVIFVNLVINESLGIVTIADAVEATIARMAVDGFHYEHRLKPVSNCLDLIADKDNPTDMEIISVLKDLDYEKYLAVKKQFFDCHHNILSLAINAILYITSPTAEVVNIANKDIQNINSKLHGLPKGIKRDNLEKLLALAKKRKIFITGGSIKIQKELNARLTDTGREVLMRHKVRGHWKYQPCGPLSELRKHIWVSPYWRGPSYAEILERNYIVSEEKCLNQ